MQAKPKGRGRGRGGGRGGSRGGGGPRDSSGRGGARGRGASRGNGRGRGRGQTAATSLGVQKGGKLRSLKNQVRGVERLLRKEDIEPRARTKQAALLEQLKLAMLQHDRSELERKYAVRYHKVRFFERVKLERQIKQAQKSMVEALPAALSQIERQVASLRDDLQYVLHFPKGEKYVSITKEVADPAAAAALRAERGRLGSLVARQLAEVAMLAEADEGASLHTTAAAAAATHDALGAETDEDDFFLPDISPVRDCLHIEKEQGAGVLALQSSMAVPEPPPVSPLLAPVVPSLKRQRGGRQVALRAAAKGVSQAPSGHVLQAGKTAPAESLASPAAHIQRRTTTAPTPTQQAATGGQHTSGGLHCAAQQHTASNGAALRQFSVRPAGQQKPLVKGEWQPRGIAQQKQQRQYEKAPVGLQSRQALSLASAAPGSAAAAAEEAPLRKRAEGGRKRRR